MKNPTEVLNDNMEYLIGSLMRELRCLGKMNGLSDPQLSYMEREFIARLAFAAIIVDDEKEPEKESEKKLEGLPEYVVKALSYVKDHCIKSYCEDCIFYDSEECHIKNTPNEWRI